MNDSSRLPTSPDTIVALFSEATDTELAYGATWYDEAHAFCRSLAKRHGVSVSVAAGVVAALSPRRSWPQNRRAAAELLATGDTHGLTLGRNKAKAIVAGAEPTLVLGGPKTLAFYDNIVRPHDSDAVTVDRHAYDATVGRVTSDRERKAFERKGGYAQVAELYRKAAAMLGERPHVVQAVVWVVWRHRYGYFAGSNFTNPSLQVGA